MLSTVARRVLSPAIVAIVLSSVLASVTLALDATWNASCNTGEVCNYMNWHWEVPAAATTSGDSDYGAGNDLYPNTGYSINNSVSSTGNLKTANDVVWYSGANYSGSSLCINAQGGAYTLGSQNDVFSSHLIAANDTC
jgi:hypothetical protein